MCGENDASRIVGAESTRRRDTQTQETNQHGQEERAIYRGKEKMKNSAATESQREGRHLRWGEGTIA
jgi:hypothetical protein